MPDDGARDSGVPVVAVVGRPNVGKSSLVNRILGRREAIVDETPGVTRDRTGFLAEWRERVFEIVDTGGLEPGPRGIESRVAEQAQVAIEAADAIVFVVDGVAGPTQDDHIVAEVLRRSDTPVLVAVNKVDDGRDEPLAAAFYRLGLGEPAPVSALHGRASGDLLDRLVERLPSRGRARADHWAAAAIVGRPNVGKSSLLNALTHEQRAIVDAAPGTTRDPVDSVLDLGAPGSLKLLDTAGMRREVQIEDPLEYFSFVRARRTLHRCDVALLVVDVSEGVTGHDQRLAGEIVERGRACVVALNKWDLLPSDELLRERLERDVRDKLRFVPWAVTVRTSAVTGRGVDRIPAALETAVRSHRRRLSTAIVNRVVQDAQGRRPHPRAGGRAVRILYAVQAAVGPPTVVLFATGRLDPSYLRHIENRLREQEAFHGSPIQLQVRIRSRDDRRERGTG